MKVPPTRKRLRHPKIDYRGPGWFFTTICAAKMKCIFGWIEDGSFLPSWIGAIVDRQWRLTESMRPGVRLDLFQVMPNHFHGILELLTEEQSYDHVISGFKAAVTAAVRQRLGKVFEVWQRGSWDHRIRDENDLHRLREYILNNVREWERDDLYVAR